MGEFDLIARFFARASQAGVPLGIGDDCALVRPATGALAVSSDMLVAGRHFFPDVSPISLGHKALAVNLSDLAAMGARPLAFTLALALPHIDETWLQGFSDGLLALADAHAIRLVGGDTTRGPLNLCITVMGEVAPAHALRRDAARAGDAVWVSGELGAAAFAVRSRLAGAPLAEDHPALARLERPEPRLALGLALVGVARAAIDLSDGLVGDLGHVLARSGLGATVDVAMLPLAACLDDVPTDERLQCALAGGDDYELLFTAPADAGDVVLRAAQAAGTPVRRIGRIESEPGLRLAGLPAGLAPLRAWDHFDGTSP